MQRRHTQQSGMRSRVLREKAAARACSGAVPSSFFSLSASPDMTRDACACAAARAADWLGHARQLFAGQGPTGAACVPASARGARVEARRRRALRRQRRSGACARRRRQQGEMQCLGRAVFRWRAPAAGVRRACAPRCERERTVERGGCVAQRGARARELGTQSQDTNCCSRAVTSTDRVQAAVLPPRAQRRCLAAPRRGGRAARAAGAQRARSGRRRGQ
jgi:hypothetical protein